MIFFGENLQMFGFYSVLALYLTANAFAEVRGRVSEQSENTELAQHFHHSSMPRRSLASAYPSQVVWAARRSCRAFASGALAAGEECEPVGQCASR